MLIVDDKLKKKKKRQFVQMSLILESDNSGLITQVLFFN